MSDCAGCKSRYWVEASPWGTSSSGYGCRLTGGHAVSRCSEYEGTSGDNEPFLLVSRSVYRELMDAELREQGRSEGGISTGSEMRKVLMKYIPHETDILPNPVRVAVKSSEDVSVEVVQQWRRP